MFYKVTLTASGGLSPYHVDRIRDYILEHCKHAYIVNEFGESKMNSHLEGVVEFDTSTASNVTDRFKRLYRVLEIEVVQNVTIKVRTATNIAGALIYASKELRDKGNLVLLKGWESTWIDQQMKENVKNIPHSMLKKQGTRISQSYGPALMYEWCIANNMHIQYKLDFLEVVDRMGDEGYMFGTCRHLGLFQDVCSLFGTGRAARNTAESELRFVD